MHDLMLLAGMSNILDDMLLSIARAKRRVWIETFIVRDDRLGHVLARALIDARRRGLDVRLLFDALGSQHITAELLDRLHAGGVDARAYRPTGHFRGVFPRDHARNMLVDDVGYTGGSAWGDEWLPLSRGGKGWHDVCIRIIGPATQALEELYLARWERSDDRAVTSAESEVIRCGDVTVMSDLARGAARILDAHLAAIARARQRVWIENAYFFPPRALLRALFAAVERGVDVRLLLPGDTDLPIVTHAARGEYSRWLRRGLVIFEYARTVLHSKIAVVDDDWCTVGTFNINAMSVACTHEMNVIIEDRAVVADVAKQIEHDLGDGVRMRLDDVRRWALGQRIQHRVAAFVLRAIEWPLEHRVPSILWSPSATESLGGRAPERLLGAQLADRRAP